MRNLDYPNSHEGKMMMNRLATIERVARYLRSEIQPTDDLPQWTLAKVAVAENNLTRAMQYLVSRIQLQNEMAGISDFLPTNYKVCKNQDYYMVDHDTERKLQNQRKFAYAVASPILVYSGAKMGGSLGIAVSAIGLICGVMNYKQFQTIKKLDSLGE